MSNVAFGVVVGVAITLTTFAAVGIALRVRELTESARAGTLPLSPAEYSALHYAESPFAYQCDEEDF